MDSPRIFNEIYEKLDNAGLLNPNRGTPGKVSYPPAGADDRWSSDTGFKDTPAFDHKTFGVKCGLASLAMRLVNLAKQDLYNERPEEAIRIVEEAARKMANLALTYRG